MESIPIIETHAHYFMSNFKDMRDQIIPEMIARGIVKFVNPATDIHSNTEMRRCFEKKSYEAAMYYTVGLHPLHVFMRDQNIRKEDRGDFKDDRVPLKWSTKRDEGIRKQLKLPKVVAVGEIGLDYSRDYTDELVKQIQREFFIRFIDYANQYKKPAILHIRPKATVDERKKIVSEDPAVFEDAVEILREHPIRYGAVLHCFCSNMNIVRKLLEHDTGVKYFGIGGAIGDRANEGFIEMIRELSLEKLLLETDAPFQPFEFVEDTEKNEPVTSLTLFKVIDRIARIKGISSEEVARVTYSNACEFFGFEE